MPRLKETENQRIDREWNALCVYRMKMMRMNTEKLAKKLDCCRPTATDRIRSPRFLKLHQIMQVCAVLQIDFDDFAKIVKGA